jgi:putative ABC transport system permease protein
MTLVVRTATTPASMVSAVTNAIHEVDGTVPVRDVLTMNDLVTKSLSQSRFNTLLLGVFAGLALLLAAIGIYSVLSYSVRQRVPEIGIRLALGARMTDVLRMVVIEGMKPTLFGVAIGMAAALAMGRLVASMIFQVKPSDPATFLAVAALLAFIALLACIIPAYRASKVDPVIALRNE